MTSTTLHPAVDHACLQCRGDGYVVARGGEHAVAEPCRCVSAKPCPACRGTGFVAVSSAFRAPRQRCICQRLAGRIRAFNESGIPSRHANSTRASYDPSGARMKSFARINHWLKAYQPGQENRGLVLWGEVGRGKTHLLVAVLRDLIFQHGVRARFVEFSHLLADLKAGFDVGRGMAALIDPLVKVEVLAIDELGKGMRTDFEITVIDELISRRYNAMLPTLATTNYAPEAATGRVRANLAEAQLGTGALPTLSDRVGDRVFSRLRETSEFIELRGDDWRERTRGRLAR